ncbi:uncharacterized protein SAPINGB_P001066 [Magnusiomyces paraingens]|uniref:Sphingolipid delta(4)-desaturase n=1 Tax=Magnusiomyces paraingens TaxID=2606893 RepID=A0A5E8BA08_9ASCO|nr:uncharacterized protein SAPINGB_P001066 [Saprochaete ingens]VVT46140.1 unnamed protein product [Saprochaete ingens]
MSSTSIEPANPLSNSTLSPDSLPEVASSIVDDETAALGPNAGSSAFFWTYQEEPHRSRRKAIIKAHPQVTKLCGPEPLTKWVVLGVMLTQFTIAYYLTKTNTPFFSFKFWALAYVIGATCSQNLFLAIHEMAHGLGFKTRIHNQLFAVVANLPIGIPYAAGFGPYHLLHHKYLGDSQYDTDLPTVLEALVLDSVAGKAFFATFQIFFYAIRPICVMAIPFSKIHVINLVTQFVWDYIVVHNFGWTPLVYFLLSDFLAGSLHPLAGHFIAEHYVLDPPAPEEKKEPKSKDIQQKGVQPAQFSKIAPPETYSYYGPLNIFVYNAGYHNEHHDFPYVAWTKLPELNRLAKEFYDPLPCHRSWSKVIVDFVFDKRVSLWCRVKRSKEQIDPDDYEHPENSIESTSTTTGAKIISPAAALAARANIK